MLISWVKRPSSISFHLFLRAVTLPSTFLMGYNEDSLQGKRTCSESHLSSTGTEGPCGMETQKLFMPAFK